MCTDFILPFKGDNPTIISGRTMDFTQSPTVSYITTAVKIPVGRNFKADAPHGKGKGHHWNNKYGFIGLNMKLKKSGNLEEVEEKVLYCDGLNTEGFSAAVLWYAYSKYEAPKSKDYSKYLDIENVVSFLLGNCTKVEDAVTLLESVIIWVQQDLEGVFPLHLTLHDRAGNSKVVEFIKGEPVYYENNDIGVLTNGPTFDWHVINFNYSYNALTNKDNSVDKSVELTKDKSGLFNIAPATGFESEVLGSGMFGLPGDSSSPSRFVRTGKLRECFPTNYNGRTGVQYALQLLGRVAVCEQEVLLYYEEKNKAYKNGKAYNPTLWMVIRNHTDRILYYCTHLNHNLQAIKLDKLDFSRDCTPTKTSISEGDWYIDSTLKLCEKSTPGEL